MFSNKKRINKLREEILESFNNVKKDFSKVGDWIKHLDDKAEKNDKGIKNTKEELSRISNEIELIKEAIGFFEGDLFKQGVKQQQKGANKQTNSKTVQTGAQTAVQTVNLEDLTIMEKAIIWALLNNEMKLSYEDISVMLGKSKSTIRGQINGIRQKNKDLIEEFIEPNGKKRIFISEKMKKIIIKSPKNSKKVKSES